MSKNDNWTNDSEINQRTRFGIKILFFIFRVLSPYEFEHRYEKELKALEDEVAKL